MMQAAENMLADHRWARAGAFPEKTRSPLFAGCRVLILEDNEFQRELAAAALASIGVGHVAKACSGGEALEIMDADARGFDVVLCDLQMTDDYAMDGVQFIRMASQRRVGAMIFMSGLNEDVVMSAEMLATSYGIPLIGRVSKPVNLTRLRTVLTNSLSRKGLYAQQARKPEARIWTKADLRTALRRDQFSAFFQPQINLATRQCTGAEALARWNHPDLGILPPSEFIPLMEREDMLEELTERIFVQALGGIHRCADARVPMRVSLNASPRTLQDVSVPNRWRAIAAEHRIDTRQITIEVTETALAEDSHGLLETVTRLRMHGFAVSLDDFGTCFSSLQQLAELPITEVKIDRSFVNRIPAMARSVTVLGHIIDLCRRLKISTVAEGIESEGIAAFLHAAGCDQGQGYLFGRPMPAEDLVKWLRNREPSIQAAPAATSSSIETTESA